MQVLIDLAYATALTLGWPYCAYKLLTRRKIRAGLKEKLGRVAPRAGEPCAWFHCVSVGEVGLARELVSRLADAHPELPIAVSTTTDTGRTFAEKSFPGRTIFYCPFDLSPAVNSTYRAIRPRCLVLVELELWPNLILSARKRNVPIMIVNGRITEKTFRRLSRVKCLVRPLLQSIHTIAVQNTDYAQRLIALGADPGRVAVTGNMKYDTVRTEIDSAHPALQAVKSLNAARMIAGGCTWEGEEEALLRVFTALKASNAGIGLTLAPKHAERLPAVRKLIEGAGYGCLPLSLLKMRLQKGENSRFAANEVILVDTFGELDAVYAAADVVFVGRSLTQHGGQNMLEPAALGKPVIFGPHTENFAEAAGLLLGAGAAVQVDSENELLLQIKRFVDDREASVRTGAKAREVVDTRKGATEKNLALLERLIS